MANRQTLVAAALRGFLPHALHQMPREACGFIVNQDGRARCITVPNIYSEPGGFMISPNDYMNAQRYHILAVVHSHVREDCAPSQADIEFADACALPQVIVSVPDGLAAVYYPVGYHEPLLGREWVYGSSDCYTLLRDAMHELGGVDLPDFQRDPFPSDQWDMFPRSYEAAGFRRVIDGFRHLDAVVFAMDTQTGRLNHCGLVVEPNHLLHHAFGRLSTREVFNDYWRQHVRLHLRHLSRMNQGGGHG